MFAFTPIGGVELIGQAIDPTRPDQVSLAQATIAGVILPGRMSEAPVTFVCFNLGRTQANSCQINCHLGTGRGNQSTVGSHPGKPGECRFLASSSLGFGRSVVTV
ncbi:hypothetical protein D9M73_289600 [compost metagenome]